MIESKIKVLKCILKKLRGLVLHLSLIFMLSHGTSTCEMYDM